MSPTCNRSCQYAARASYLVTSYVERVASSLSISARKCEASGADAVMRFLMRFLTVETTNLSTKSCKAKSRNLGRALTDDWHVKSCCHGEATFCQSADMTSTLKSRKGIQTKNASAKRREQGKFKKPRIRLQVQGTEHRVIERMTPDGELLSIRPKCNYRTVLEQIPCLDRFYTTISVSITILLDEKTYPA